VTEERPDVEFGIVVAARGRRLRSATLSAAKASGIVSRVTTASENEAGVWRPWLTGALAAIEIADADALTPSSFIVEAIAAGVPTVVSEVGSLRELPEGVVVKIPAGATADLLARETSALLKDQSRSSALRERTRAHAGEHSADALAEQLIHSLGLEAEEEGDLPIVERLAMLLPLLNRRLSVLDVGTRWGFDDRWLPLRDHVDLIGFEPDEEECARLDRLYEGWNARLVPLALGRSRGTVELHVASDPGSSSLLQPDPAVIKDRPETARIQSLATREVEMTTVDDWIDEENFVGIDALKIDVQGSELAVLEGAERTLQSVRILELEVEFNEMYEGQPLFGDIDRVLRDHGFVLWRLAHLVHYGVKNESVRFELRDQQVFENHPVDFTAEGGQLYWGHAYYVPRRLAFGGENRDWKDHVADACIVGAYGFRDLATRSLRTALESAPPMAFERISDVLARVAPDGDS
jgi:FkbM family methyltransferase